MPLKVQVNGQKKQITDVGRPLVTFVNGQKYYVVKGVTFVNGQKKVLWNSNKLSIDYIDGIKSLLGNINYIPFWSDGNQLYTTGLTYKQDKKISLFNITNKNNPILVSQVDFGAVCNCSSVDSTPENTVYYAIADYDTRKCQQININASGEINVTNVINVPTQYQWGETTGIITSSKKWLGFKNTSLYENNNFIEGLDSAVNPVPIAKKDGDNLFSCVTFSGLGTFLVSVSSSGVTKNVDTGILNGIIVDNGNIVCAGDRGLEIFTESFDTVYNENNPVQYYTHYLIGKINKFYYVVRAPYYRVTNPIVTLRIYNVSDGSLYEEIPINCNIDMFHGFSTYRQNRIYVIPTISQNRTLTFSIWQQDGSTRTVVIKGY